MLPVAEAYGDVLVCVMLQHHQLVVDSVWAVLGKRKLALRKSVQWMVIGENGQDGQHVVLPVAKDYVLGADYVIDHLQNMEDENVKDPQQKRSLAIPFHVKLMENGDLGLNGHSALSLVVAVCVNDAEPAIRQLQVMEVETAVDKQL